MNEYFARLSSLERRFVVGVMVVVFVLLNAVFVWPRFAEWGQMKSRIYTARRTLGIFEREIGQTKKYEELVKKLEGDGQAVPPEDQAVELSLKIQAQAAQSGVNMGPMAPLPVRTNSQFFIERAYSVSVTSGEQQLVDFLYNLGSGTSLTRVRAMRLHPDQPRHNLSADIRLVASYQIKAAGRPGTAAARNATSTAKKP